MTCNRLRRIVVMLDLSTVGLQWDAALRFNADLHQLIGKWTGDDSRGLNVVKRVYAPDWELRTALYLGRMAGWRQGGTGEVNEIAEYIRNDSRAFCLEEPESSGLVLCSDDVGLVGLIEDLDNAGVKVFLVERLRGGNLSARVKAENRGALRSLE